MSHLCLGKKRKGIAVCLLRLSGGVDMKTERTRMKCGCRLEEQMTDNGFGSIKVTLTVHVCDEVSEVWSMSVVTTTEQIHKRFN